MFVIKKMTDENAPVLYRKLAGLQSPLLSAERLKQAHEAGENVFLLIVEEEAAGALILAQAPEGERPAFWRVTETVILPEKRRQSYGRLLMCAAAGFAVERCVYFLGGDKPDSPEGEAFAAALHFRPAAPEDALYLLDLSDVEGLRYGKPRV